MARAWAWLTARPTGSCRWRSSHHKRADCEVYKARGGRAGQRRARVRRLAAVTAVLSTEVSTLPELLATRARELPDERFLRDARASWTYGEFAHRVGEIAARPAGPGVGRGGRGGGG